VNSKWWTGNGKSNTNAHAFIALHGSPITDQCFFTIH
jgi:hypothetical protein